MQAIEVGLLDGKMHGTMGGGSEASTFFVNRLTWQGHEFLELFATIRCGTKPSTIAEKGGSMTFDTVKGVAVSIATQAVDALSG